MLESIERNVVLDLTTIQTKVSMIASADTLPA
jgi:hypothetical protein